MKKKGFTLIELLIVVAIIAILAAIAVPNFLEAQVRSKVSRVRADIRSMVTAMESYYTDWNVPPPEAGAGPFLGRIIPPSLVNQTGILTPALSTPIAYMTNVDIFDPFMGADAGARPDVRLFTYHAYKWKWWGRDDSYFYNSAERLTGSEFKEHYGQWRIFSIGPDKQWDNIPGGSQFTTPSPVGMPYDPTNGTVSSGNIVRSQKYAEQKTWKDI